MTASMAASPPPRTPDPVVKRMNHLRDRVQADRGAAEELLLRVGLLRRDERGQLVATYEHEAAPVAER